MTVPGDDGVDAPGLGRRALLSALGLAASGAVTASAAAAPAAPAAARDLEDVEVFSVIQNGECVPVAPLVGRQRVEELYDLRIPEQYGGDNGASDPGQGPYFQSNGTTDYQQESVTISFLYLGPRGLSLVVVHDTGADGSGDSGGAVSWTVENVPHASEWAVKDDLYTDPETGELADSNYDDWDVGGTTHTIDWTWGSAGTDGGALRTIDPTLGLTIRPAFNGAAALWGDYYPEDPIEEWQFLSFPPGADSPERSTLSLSEAVSVRAGFCENPLEKLGSHDWPTIDHGEDGDTAEGGGLPDDAGNGRGPPDHAGQGRGPPDHAGQGRGPPEENGNGDRDVPEPSGIFGSLF